MNKYIYRGHLVRKRFGQIFLHDSSIIDAIITAIHPNSNQAIVEIGPGLGALTIPIIERAGNITVIELDRVLANRLAKQSFFKSKLNIIQQDAMIINFSKLSAKFGQPLRIFGNLPYNISTPLIIHLLNYTDSIYDMHFMLQKEMAKRLIANPNTKAYGRLSVLVQYYCKVIEVLEVSSNSFRPIPKVDSVLIRLIPYTEIPFPVKELSKLTNLTKIVFNQRRKTLINSVKNIFNEQQLLELGIDTKLRAENISVEQYCNLANILAKDNIL